MDYYRWDVLLQEVSDINFKIVKHDYENITIHFAGGTAVAGL